MIAKLSALLVDILADKPGPRPDSGRPVYTCVRCKRVMRWPACCVATAKREDAPREVSAHG